MGLSELPMLFVCNMGLSELPMLFVCNFDPKGSWEVRAQNYQNPHSPSSSAPFSKLRTESKVRVKQFTGNRKKKKKKKRDQTGFLT
jgi:hypothetical protein